ncbi:hypothetical protein SAMN05444161_6955 [Rhizobiales bacterium GAS191]|nr:hypothetical protein SAMN05519103_06271 [Rhizobiales bacterium GAS113]SEE74346.1 hypothetical protein SAMN05444161_6955 [Rhizobiales bacterium GAS191]
MRLKLKEMYTCKQNGDLISFEEFRLVPESRALTSVGPWIGIFCAYGEVSASCRAIESNFGRQMHSGATDDKP